MQHKKSHPLIKNTDNGSNEFIEPFYPMATLVYFHVHWAFLSQIRDDNLAAEIIEDMSDSFWEHPEVWNLSVCYYFLE
jgi:hypothetical protein